MSVVNSDSFMSDIQRHVQVCFQCQTCTSGCPVFKALPAFKPASLAQQLARSKTVPFVGEYPAYWLCAGCYACESKCPQGVELAHVFFKLKNWAVENKGPVPKGIIAEAAMMKTGKTVAVAQSILQRRSSMGLPSLPQADTEEIQRILVSTNFQGKLDALVSLEVQK